MLKITKRPGEALILNTADGQVRIEFGLGGRQIKLAIDAPNSIKILRDELERQSTPSNNDNNSDYGVKHGRE